MKCTVCGEKIYFQCADDEPYKIRGEPVCRDCYYDELGAFIEKNPICSPEMILFGESRDRERNRNRE